MSLALGSALWEEAGRAERWISLPNRPQGCRHKQLIMPWRKTKASAKLRDKLGTSLQALVLDWFFISYK